MSAPPKKDVLVRTVICDDEQGLTVPASGVDNGLLDDPSVLEKILKMSSVEVLPEGVEARQKAFEAARPEAFVAIKTQGELVKHFAAAAEAVAGSLAAEESALHAAAASSRRAQRAEESVKSALGKGKKQHHALLVHLKSETKEDAAELERYRGVEVPRFLKMLDEERADLRASFKLIEKKNQEIEKETRQRKVLEMQLGVVYAGAVFYKALDILSARWKEKLFLPEETLTREKLLSAQQSRIMKDCGRIAHNPTVADAQLAVLYASESERGWIKEAAKFDLGSDWADPFVEREEVKDAPPAQAGAAKKSKNKKKKQKKGEGKGTK
eukprot:m51a1_g551 hypothetical protein (326) ;mRNA; f:451293-452660